MNKTTKRILTPTITFAAGVTATALLLNPFNAATAEPASSTHQATTQVADSMVQAAKAALQSYGATASATALAYAAPGGPTTFQDVKIGNTTGRIWYNKISANKLYVNDQDTGWISRYEVQIKRADGKVLYDKNFTVYRMAWFANKFDVDKTYASDAAVVAAANVAAEPTEIEARAIFKKQVGSLGVIHEAGGGTRNPYDFSKHPGVKYIPLDYKG